MITRPRLAISLGDPRGIGPEITAAALQDSRVAAAADYVLVGPRGTTLDVQQAVGDWTSHGTISDAGRFAGLAVDRAIQLAQSGDVQGIVTAPLDKRALLAGGYDFPGHTELLAARFGVADVAMMFAGPRLTVALATIHIPLAEVVRALTTARIRRVVELVHASLVRDFAIAAPRIGVVGLNPHAGEGGLLGREDAEVIAPALLPPIPGTTLVGPLVPDVAFRDALDRRYDALVAMYHDQGLIPVKLVDFDEAVNVTLGLPIVRTSPDHGTAYDIAGRGLARPTSMRRAVALAFAMADRRAGVGSAP